MDENKNETPLQKFLTMKQKSKEASQSKFAEEARKKLDSIISKKMNTTFIGALSSFEKAFGFLWGFGKKDSEKTDEEKELYNIWQNVRTEVLNNGNNQLRALRNELQNHTISWNRHKITFVNEEINDDQ